MDGNEWRFSPKGYALRPGVRPKGETVRSEIGGAVEVSGNKLKPPLKKGSLGEIVLELAEVTKKQE